MKNRKPYTPTMPKRKLKNLTLITEKNIGKVMGQLNHFFSKPTLILNGFAPKVIGYKTEIWGNEKFKFEEYSEELYPYYRIYQANCDWHYIWKEYLAGKKVLIFKDIKDIPRLAISGKYTDGCIPLEIGDAYKIYGNRLIIMHKWDKYIHHTPWMRFTEFISVPSYNETEFRNYKIDSCVSIFTDALYDFAEGWSYEYAKLFRELAKKMHYHIKTILRRDYSLEKTEVCLSFEQQDFSIVVYPKKALNSNNKENYILIIDSDSNQYTNAIQFAENLVEKIIKERNEEYSKYENFLKSKKYDENLGWDFYSEDLLY